jgi:hypothetical protein
MAITKSRHAFQLELTSILPIRQQHTDESFFRAAQPTTFWKRKLKAHPTALAPSKSGSPPS